LPDRPDLESFALVLLRRPADAPALSEEEAEALQAEHLAHLAAMRESGKLAASGPFSDQPDEAWRGLCLYKTSLEEARVAAERDPAVRAGRLAVDVLTWWTRKGTIAPRT
jgi:uncharacterized protein